MNASEEFVRVIKYLFGEELAEGEEFKEKYKKVLCKNKTTGRYGDCDSVKQLMLYIRKKMRESGYAPNCPLPETFNVDDEKQYKEIVIEGMENQSKFKEAFPETYKKEKSLNKLEYQTDGWNYKGIDYQIEDWIYKKRGDYHCYYNQLDHYLSHLASIIAKEGENGKMGNNIKGIKKIQEELNCKM